MRQKLSRARESFFALASIVLLTLLAPVTMTFPVALAQAKSSGQSVSQGLVVQVDRTNSKEVTFSLLDRHGASRTFHLTAQTRFSERGLTVNTFVLVKAKPDAVWGFDALQVQIQHRTQGSFAVQGLLAAVNQGQKSLTLALNDGTMLSIAIEHASLTHTQPGAFISLQAHFTPTGSLVAATFRISASHARRFTARGIINYLNVRTHRITLVTPSGATFSVVQPHAQGHTASSLNGLRVGELVEVSGSTDGQGNLDEQNASVDNTDEQQVILQGIVGAIDTTANTFSMLDVEGNDSTLKADPSLLTSIKVGGVYQIEATIGSDGSMTALQILASLGTDQGATLALEGIVQTYDASGGILSFAGQNGQSFTLLVSSQTVIITENGASPTLASGQAIHAIVQHTTENSYTAISIKIEDNSGHQGDNMTFSGSLQAYDAASGQLTISTGESQTLSFVTTTGTIVVGAASLDAIVSGTSPQIEAQVQQDGSYLASKVEVQDNQGDDMAFSGSLQAYDAASGQLMISTGGSQTLSFGVEL